jgi:uracil-DNA glycosylase
LDVLRHDVESCTRCPRLVKYCAEVARTKRRSFADWEYWGKPVAGFGDPKSRLWIIGLAPGAHGANRTGRVFTGDRSGDWLFASLHAVGLANRPESVHAGDGLRLVRTRVVAAVRCAPPANKLTPAERDTCAPWLDAELARVRPSLRVVVALGSFAWDAALAAFVRSGDPLPRPRPVFGHGARAELGAVTLLGSYHPSQQNTFTGRLTREMLDSVLGTAASLADAGRSRPRE